MDQDTRRAMLREAVREVGAEVLQNLMGLDREAFLRENGGRRNGHHRRRPETSFGPVSLKVPRDREGRCYPIFLTPYPRRLVDVGEVAVALDAAGVRSPLFGHRSTHETIGAIADRVLEKVKAFRGRPLPEEMAFVYLDGFFLKVHREGLGVEREAVYVALGVTPSGGRQILGCWLLPTESAPWWQGVLRERWGRGLRRVLPFITDGLPGVEEAIRRVYPLAGWQGCVVHLVGQSRGLIREWNGSRSGGVDVIPLGWLRGGKTQGRCLWPYLRGTNRMERLIREVRRATQVRDNRFPRPEAVEEPVSLVAEGEEWKWAGRRWKGFAGIQEERRRMPDQRYAPQTQTLTHKS